MPTYEYECQSCKEHFDVFQSMTDEPLSACPKCGGSVSRLIGSGSGIIFKGSGFYATDHRKGKNEDSISCPKKEGGEGCKSCPSAGK
ncbi:MAG: FmdB family zinc ribbon protein [Candidatus Omnitrophota bacterium]